MKTRDTCLLGLGVLWGAGVGFLACSSSSGGFDDGGPSDGGTDITTMFDTGKDTYTPPPDHNHPDDAPHPTDGGSDAPTDSGLKGGCSPVNGPACDIVLQNCPKDQECVIVSDPSAESGLGFTTGCQKSVSAEHLPSGTFCCPGDTNQCDPGTTCVGDPCIGDAGSGGGGGRCSPACCPSDAGPNTANCGVSMPEGYLGYCDISLSGGNPIKGDDSGSLYTACTYESTCTVFVAPCSPGYTCLVGTGGKSTCSTIDVIDAKAPEGLGNGAPCMYANVCAQELACIGFADAGYTCSYLCYIPGGSPPFDAGELTGKPGGGGCPKTYTCEGVTGFPSWLGVCDPP